MTKTITIKELMDKSTSFLKKKLFLNPKHDVEILLSEILKMDRLDLYLNLDRQVTPEKVDVLRHAIKSRSKNTPLSYILKTHQFLNLKLKINQNIFIPRPETEILVDMVMHKISSKITHKFHLLDIGTGCGNIAIAIATKSNLVKILAIDKSYESIKIAEENAQLHRVSKKIQFFQFDIFEDEFKRLRTRTRNLDIIISNPPYIPEKLIEQLPEEVRLYEPMDALNGGKDGLEFIKKIILMSNGLLKNKGFLFLEIGDNQAEDTKKIASKFFDVNFKKDLNGIDRVFIGKKKSKFTSPSHIRKERNFRDKKYGK